MSISRGREAVRVYTDDKEAMLDAVQDSAARLSATELMQGANPMPSHKPAVPARHQDIRHIKRVYNRLRERIAGQDFMQTMRKHLREALDHGKH